MSADDSWPTLSILGQTLPISVTFWAPPLECRVLKKGTLGPSGRSRRPPTARASLAAAARRWRVVGRVVACESSATASQARCPQPLPEARACPAHPARLCAALVAPSAGPAARPPWSPPRATTGGPSAPSSLAAPPLRYRLAAAAWFPRLLVLCSRVVLTFTLD